MHPLRYAKAAIIALLNFNYSMLLRGKFMAEWIIYITEILGTIAFSASGAMIGIQRRLDLFGIIVISVVTSFGGGTIRDIVLGHFPPRMFYNFELLALSVLVAVIVFAISAINMNKGKKIEKRN